MKQINFKIIYGVLIIALLALYYMVPKGADIWVIVPCLLIFYCLLFKSLAKPIQLGNIKSFIKIDVLFYMFSYLLYYYPYQRYVFGLTDLTTQYSKLNQYIEYTNMSIILSTIAMLAFALGYCWHKTNQNNIHIQHNKTAPNIKQINKMIAVLLLLIVSLGIYYFMSNGINALIYAYGSDNAKITSNTGYKELIFFMMLLSGIFVCYWKYYPKRSFLFFISLAVILFWTIYLLLLGDRNSFFLIAIVLVGGYFNIIKSVSRKYLVIFLFGSLLIYNIVEIVRITDDRSITTVIDAYRTMQEKEGSSFDITTLGYRFTLDYIPDKHEYFYGKFTVLSLTSIVPFLSGLFVDANDIYTSSSKVITYTLRGTTEGWSFGSNIISDLYVDFGVVGVIFFMLLIGKYAEFIKDKFIYNNSSVKWITLYLVTLALLAEIPRYGLAFPIRNIVWAFLFFWIFDRKQTNKI